MQVIGLFVFFVIVLNAITIGICSLIERSSEFAGLIAFLVMFVGNFVIAWKTALYLTERYLVVDARPSARQDAGMARSAR